MRRRVVITGMGVIAPNARNLSDFLLALKQGKSGVSQIQSFDTSKMRVHIGGEVKDFSPRVENSEKMDRISLLALAAAREAWGDAHYEMEDPRRVGVIFGTIGGGVLTLEKRVLDGIDDPEMSSKLSSLSPPRWIAQALGIEGEVATLSNACAAGAISIGYALEQIRQNRLEVALAGGGETFNRATFCGFHALRSLDPIASRPFCKERQGLVLGEGAAFVLLEHLEHAIKRGARIYAEVAGCGLSSDAYHETAPDPSGDGAARSMRAAMEDAQVNPEEVSYINAHGTATPQNDQMETLAIKKAFGELAYKIPVSSVKSMIGHTMGAAGAIEVVASVLAIKHSFVPPTINYTIPDPACDLDVVPNHAREQEVRMVLSNKFGFGGTNVSLVIKEFN